MTLLKKIFGRQFSEVRYWPVLRNSIRAFTGLKERYSTYKKKRDTRSAMRMRAVRFWDIIRYIGYP